MLAQHTLSTVVGSEFTGTLCRRGFRTARRLRTEVLEAEAFHRDHAIVEQVIADLKAGPLAHLPSGVFTANAAWLVCAAIAFNLTRAAGVIASTAHARARTATIRAQLIQVPARVANHARKWRLHLPTAWPWQAAWESLFDRAHGTAAAIA